MSYRIECHKAICSIALLGPVDIKQANQAIGKSIKMDKESSIARSSIRCGDQRIDLTRKTNGKATSLNWDHCMQTVLCKSSQK